MSTLSFLLSMLRSRKREVSPVSRRLSPALALVAVFVTAVPSWGTIALSLAQAAGGAPLTGTGPAFDTGFGNVNGLGVGTPSTGVAIINDGGAVGGVLYTTPYNIVVTGMGSGGSVHVTGYVSTNFTNSAILAVESCQVGVDCTTSANYTALSTDPNSPTDIIPAPGQPNGTYTATLGLYVSNADGAGAFTGTDTAVITLVATNLVTGRTSTVTLTLDTPAENVQTAVMLILTSAPGGATINPASDFALDFGNANGLGLGIPSAGLSIVASTGGVIYSTPYLIVPSFSSFTDTTSSISVYVSVDFLNPNTLQLSDSTAPDGPYNNISKSPGTPTSITTTAASAVTLSRYLGLFVSAANGAGAFPGTFDASGADGATLTYTMTVP